jgi:hypothetical protein
MMSTERRLNGLEADAVPQALGAGMWAVCDACHPHARRTQLGAIM